MKVKFQQLNKQDKENDRKEKQLSKDSHVSTTHSSTQKSKRNFGIDINKQQLNIPYNFVVPKDANLYTLPQFFKKKVKQARQIACYEEEILKYIINTHDDYDLMQKTKKAMKKKQRRLRVVLFYIAICKKFRLRQKTLFLATYYYDKYIEKNGPLSVEKQAISAQACLLIAMKYQEIYPPYLKEWTSNVKEVIKAESLILKSLDFKLAFTTAYHYLEIYISKMPNQSKQRINLYQSILQFYLVIGKIYNGHPLTLVQQVIDSFRSTSILEHETSFYEMDRKLQIDIVQNRDIWQKVISYHF